jgi:non-ribosomal peptide synthetase component F
LNIDDGLRNIENAQSTYDRVREIIRRPFDLSKDYMLRADLIGLNETDHLLVVTMHHIASDGWSLSIIVKEVIELYGSFIEKRQAKLPELLIQYADFSVWQRSYLQGELLNKKIGYWKEKLEGVAPLELPTDFRRPAVQSTKGASTGFQIERNLAIQLQKLGQQQGVTLFMLMLTVFKVLLYRYSGQKDICVGTPIAGRQQAELQELVGFFINMLALRTEVNSEGSFIDLLQQVKATMLQAQQHQDVPYEKIVESLSLERDHSRSPLFQVMFIVQNTTGAPRLQLGELELSTESVSHNTSKFDLTLSISETPDGLHGTVEYCTDLYDDNTIGRLIQHFQGLLVSIIKNPKESIGKLEMLAELERKQLLFDFNNTQENYPKDKTVLDLFEEQANKNASAIALVYDEESVTYQQLNERSNGFACLLQSEGVEANTLVPVCIERSIEMLVGILGILKAGAAFIPLDPDYPEERIKYMLEDAQAEIVVTSRNSRIKLPAKADLKVIEIDNDQEFLSSLIKENPRGLFLPAA